MPSPNWAYHWLGRVISRVMFTIFRSFIDKAICNLWKPRTGHPPPQPPPPRQRNSFRPSLKMAAPRYETKQYTSEQFVESCGAILFNKSTKQICLVKTRQRKTWVLAKGRRNVHEKRIDAALREVKEETGFTCQAMPVSIRSRATPWDEGPQGPGTVTPDVARLFENAVEPFMITHRFLPQGCGIKLIYWFLASIDESVPKGPAEALFSSSELFYFEDALNTLTFSTDREIVTNAIEIFEATENQN